MACKLRERPPGSGRFIITVELGYELVPILDATGQPVLDAQGQPTARRKRRQRWITFHGTRKEAVVRQREVLRAQDEGRFVEPSKVTLIDWVRSWLAKSVKPLRRPATYRVYRSHIENHLAKADCAFKPLQQVRSSDLEQYLASLRCAQATVHVHKAILQSALKRAVKESLLEKTPCVALEWPGKGEGPGLTAAARTHCWSRHEAARVLAVAQTADAQTCAFMMLALDSGARKSELHGLGWQHVDLEAGTLTIDRQLTKAGVAPVFGPPKTKRSRRTIVLLAETVAALRVHKQSQAELKMRNRTSYADHGLIFAKEDRDLQRPQDGLGQPIQTLAADRFLALVKAAGVKVIRFHGCRHTVATLSLQAGANPVDVAGKLGHSVDMLLTIYAHATLEGQKATSAALGTELYRR